MFYILLFNFCNNKNYAFIFNLSFDKKYYDKINEVINLIRINLYEI